MQAPRSQRSNNRVPICIALSSTRSGCGPSPPRFASQFCNGVPAQLLVWFDANRFDVWNAGELGAESADELPFGDTLRFGLVSRLDGERDVSLDATTVRFHDVTQSERALLERA